MPNGHGPRLGQAVGRPEVEPEFRRGVETPAEAHLRLAVSGRDRFYPSSY